MEAPRDIQESKRFRWVGRPSEEELLGAPSSLAPRRMPSLQPPPRATAPTGQALVDPFEAAPKWRFQGRDLLALAAIAAAVWFAIRGAEGLPFHHSGSLGAAEAADQVAARITLGHELGPPSRRAAERLGAAENVSGEKPNQGGSGPGSSDGGSGSKEHPKPSPTSSDAPLLQATVPGVGSVTVEQPKLPDDQADSPPTLPDAGQLTAGTPTVPLP